MQWVTDVYNYIIKNFVILTGLITGIKWLYEYSQKRKFEKSKFLLERIEKFDDLENTKVVKKMLDWNKSKFKIAPNSTVIITDSILIEALTTHDKKSDFNEIEVWIRDQFDEYLDNLNEFILLSECDLVDKKNLRKMMIYWIEILNGNKRVKPRKFSNQIQSYLLFYGYHDVAAFVFQNQKNY